MNRPVETRGETQETPIDQLPPRERILMAALQLFVEQGYFNTNVPDISKHSRCSIGSIYHHFLNKEEIGRSIYLRGIERFRSEIASALERKSVDSLESTVETIVTAFMCFPEREILLSRYLWLARHKEFLSLQLQRPTSVGFDKLGRRLTKIIKQSIRDGLIPNSQVDLIWCSIFGIPVTYIRDWMDGLCKEPPSAVAHGVAQACVAALKNLPPSRPT